MSEDQIIYSQCQKIPIIVPDKIEFHTERCDDLCEFVYREYFTYMPSDAANDLLLLTIRCMKIEHGKVINHLTINRLNNGIEIRGKEKPVEVASRFVKEVLVFAAQNQEDAKKILLEVLLRFIEPNPDDIKKRLEEFKFVAFNTKKRIIRDWNDAINKEIRNILREIRATLKENNMNLLQ